MRIPRVSYRALIVAVAILGVATEPGKARARTFADHSTTRAAFGALVATTNRIEFATAPSVAAASQDLLVAPQPGERVRLALHERAASSSKQHRPEFVEGRFVDSTDAILRVETDSGIEEYAASELHAILAVRGTRRRVGRGAMIGATTGLVISLIGAARTPSGSGFIDDRALVLNIIVPGATALGAILGAGVGAFVKVDAWTPVTLPWNAAIRLEPGGLGLAWAF